MQVFMCVRTQKIAFNAHTRIYANSIELSSRQICYASKQNAKYVAKFRVCPIVPKANSDLIFSRYCPFHCTVGKDTVISRPLKSPFLRDIVQVQYLAYFLKHAQKSFHSSFEVICCCREKYVHSISYHTLIKVAAQTIIRL